MQDNIISAIEMLDASCKCINKDTLGQHLLEKCGPSVCCPNEKPLI